MLHAISEFFTSINAPTGTIVIWSVIGFALCWLTVLLLGILTAKLIENEDYTYRQEMRKEFSSIGDTIFFMGGIYSLALFFWHIDKLVVVSQIVMWIITIMAVIDCISFISAYIVVGVQWLLKEAKYYKYNSLSEKTKDAAVVILQILSTILSYGIYIVFTCIIIFN